MPPPPNIQFAHIFLSQEGTKYLYVDQIGAGTNSAAQRVINCRTGEVVVRKVSIRMPQSHDDVSQADNEVRMIQLLQDVSLPVQYTITPRLARLLSSENAISPDGSSPRISYWKYYNGEPMSEFVCRYNGEIPVAIVARYAEQVLQSLEHMYRNGVVHGDLHMGNVWVHWETNSQLPDFYIGDFGSSLLIWEMNDTLDWKWDVPEIRSHIIEMVRADVLPGSDPWDQVLAMPALSTVVLELEKLDTLIHSVLEGGGLPASLPSLGVAIRLARDAETAALRKDAGHVNYREPHEAHIPKSTELTPLCCKDVVELHREPLVHGPWHIAVVDTAVGKVLHYNPTPQQ